MKKIVVFFLFGLFCAAPGINAQSAPVYSYTGTQITTEAALQNAINNMADNVPGIIVVMNDIVLTATITVPQLKNPVIVSNDVVKLSVNGDLRHFSTMSGGNTGKERSLTIGGNIILTREEGYDGNGGGILVGSGKDGDTHVLTLQDNAKIINNYSVGSVIEVNSGTFNMNGGAISNNTSRGVGVHGGALVIREGEITHNTGGGVIISNGGYQGVPSRAVVSYMEGGRISNNTAQVGSGLDLNGGTVLSLTFTMSGGEISDNISNSSGGGIYVGYSMFKMEGGTISGNKAVINGGGIYVANYSNLDIGAAAIFSNNTAAVAHNYGAENKGANHTLTAAQTGISGVSGNIQNILWATTSIPGTHLLNNYDIAYRGGEPINATDPGNEITWEIGSPTAANIIATLSDGTLTISGTGVMQNYEYQTSQPWAAHRSSITSVSISEGVTTIGDYAFCDFQKLMSIHLPASIETIGKLAFWGSGIHSATIPGNMLKTIGYQAFDNCANLTSITIPASVESIGALAFFRCLSMTSIEVDPDNETYSSEEGVLFNRNKTSLIAYPAGKKGSYTIPASVEIIVFRAFYDCKSLTSVSIPASVEIINEYAFCESGIRSANISGNTLKMIGIGAFWNCHNLAYINIPASVENIYNFAFRFSNSLTEVVNQNPKPITIPNNVFDGVDLSVCTLRVPAASVNDYIQAEVWKEFKYIVALETGITIELDKKEIYLLTGTTTMLTSTVTGGDIVTWHSNDETVVTVNDTGTITAIKAGTTVITANAGPEEATCIVNVIQSGYSTIEGTVNNAGTGNVRVNLYIKVGEKEEIGKKGEEGGTKKGIIGGYVLLATTVPNSNGEYKFENLPEGSYKVEVEMDDYEPGITDELPISENETLLDVNFTVDDTAKKIIVDNVIISVTTGTVETWHAASLQIYPNPFTDVLHITGAVAVETWRAASLQIFNTAGAIVHTQTISSPDETIHLGHLPAGMYIIRLENGETVKIIKIQ